MNLLQVHDLRKEYEGRPILRGVRFKVGAGERVGLVGPNGGGKSTLLKILAGELEADEGRADWSTDSRAYLPQTDLWEPEQPLAQQIGPVPPGLLARCGITRVELAQAAGTLSGGQKTRAALAQVLSSRPEFLLLDEPTNHLDEAGLQWLESLLVGYRGTVLVVSHDRAFLDRVATRIVELEGGRTREYSGNYSAYARQKQAEREKADKEYRQTVGERQRLAEAIRRQQQWGQMTSDPAQSKAHMSVARAMTRRLDRLQAEKPREAARIGLKVESSLEGGRHILLAEELGFAYDGGRWLFRQGRFQVQRGDRVALLGPNGSGKSTLVRLMLGELTPTEGRLRVAPVRTAYLAQEMENLNPAQTVLEEAADGNSAADQAEVRTMLGCLLFQREEVFKRVGVLSGGERVRLALAKILLSRPDLLILDEPTNGLDLLSRERVEEALEAYAGTLVLVSHDRYHLRRIATRVLSLEGGRLEWYGGSYAEFAERGAAGAEPEGLADRRLLLETRLARLSAALDNPAEGEAEELKAEFLAVSRELRALR